MEEIIEDLFFGIETPEIVFVAEYDPDTGQVNAVGPSHAFDSANTVVIDPEIAEQVIEGKIRISSCVIDMQSNTMEITEIKSVFKIDDVLHRIVSVEYTDVTPDVYITRNNNSLIIELNEDLGGTHKISEGFKQRRILWSGDTVMNFLVTDYNDPNVLYEMITLKISDLVGKRCVYDNLDIPNKFSVYTRRLFKNYVIEDK